MVIWILKTNSQYLQNVIYSGADSVADSWPAQKEIVFAT